jgi:hypothetical protein
MKTKIYLITISILLIFFIFLIFEYNRLNTNFKIVYQQQISEKLKISKKFHQYIYQNFPIFEDWLDSTKTMELRTYLYPEHIKIAKKLNLSIIKELQDKNNDYINIDIPEIRKYYFFYNVPSEYRFLYKDFLPYLILIGERFNHKIRFNEYPINVKIAISSLIRPERYQKELKLKNQNAIENSTHSYGISIDIFYDEFMVDLLFLCNNIIDFYKKECISDLSHHGYLIGGSLRRQFQSILAETLLELQNEKKIYVIWEKNQRIFHITPIP